MIDDEHIRYQQRQQQQLEQWEQRCGRCGACCGAFDGDPCEHLAVALDRKYFCLIYSDRFGSHRTVSGKTINCVPIRDILHAAWPGDHCCGYKK